MTKIFNTCLSLSALLSHLHQVYHQYQQDSSAAQIDRLQVAPFHNKAVFQYLTTSFRVCRKHDQIHIGCFLRKQLYNRMPKETMDHGEISPSIKNKT